MSIEGLIGGVMMLISSVSTGEVTSKTVWDTAVIVDKVIIKTEEGTWKDSAHEEGHQAVKDAIRNIGKR